MSRLIYGLRVSTRVGVLSQLIIVLVGIAIGALAGVVGSWFDFAIMRLIDVHSSLPALLFYILLMVALGSGFGNGATSTRCWVGARGKFPCTCIRDRSSRRRAPHLEVAAHQRLFFPNPCTMPPAEGAGHEYN